MITLGFWGRNNLFYLLKYSLIFLTMKEFFYSFSISINETSNFDTSLDSNDHNPKTVPCSLFSTFCLPSHLCEAAPQSNPPMFMFYYCITNYHKLSGSKQHTCIISQFPWVGGQAPPNWVLCSGSHKAVIKVLARAKVLTWGSGSSSKLTVISRSNFFVIGGLTPLPPFS